MDRAKAHTGESSSSWLPAFLKSSGASFLMLSYWLLLPAYFSKNRNSPLACFGSVLLVSVILITGVTAVWS